VGLAASHTLGDCYSNPSFTALYDQWRLDEVSCKLTWMGGVRASSSTIAPTFYFYSDFDDAVPPNALQLILGKQGVMTWSPGSDETRSVTYKFKPRLSTTVAVPGAEGAPGFGNVGVAKPGQWIDCLQPQALHYGTKIYLRDMSTPDNTVNPNLENGVRIEFAYRISFRNPIRCT
jgi:hypothetical protein